MNFIDRFSNEMFVKLTLNDICYQYQDENGKWHYGMQVNPPENYKHKHVLSTYYKTSVGFRYEERYFKSFKLFNGLDHMFDNKAIKNFIKGDETEFAEDHLKNRLKIVLNDEDAEEIFNEIDSKTQVNDINKTLYEYESKDEIILCANISDLNSVSALRPSDSEIDFNYDNPIFTNLFDSRAFQNVTSKDDINWLTLSFETVEEEYGEIKSFVLRPRKDFCLFSKEGYNTVDELNAAMQKYNGNCKNNLLSFRTGSVTSVDEDGFKHYVGYEEVENNDLVQNLNCFGTLYFIIHWFVDCELADDFVSSKRKQASIYIDRYEQRDYTWKYYGFSILSTCYGPVSLRKLLKEFKFYDTQDTINLKCPDLGEITRQKFISIGHLASEDFAYNYGFFYISDSSQNGALTYDDFLCDITGREKYDSTKFNKLIDELDLEPYIYDKTERAYKLNPQKYRADKPYYDTMFFNLSYHLKYEDNEKNHPFDIKDYDDFKQTNRLYLLYNTPRSYTLITDQEKTNYGKPSGKGLYTKEGEKYIRVPYMENDDPENVFKDGVDYYKASYTSTRFNFNKRSTINKISDTSDDIGTFLFDNVVDNDNKRQLIVDSENDRVLVASGLCFESNTEKLLLKDELLARGKKIIGFEDSIKDANGSTANIVYSELKDYENYESLKDVYLIIHDYDDKITKIKIDVTKGPQKIKNIINNYGESHWKDNTYTEMVDSIDPKIKKSYYMIKNGEEKIIDINDTIFDESIDLYPSTKHTDTINVMVTPYSYPNYLTSLPFKSSDPNILSTTEMINYFTNLFESAKTDETVKNKLKQDIDCDYTNYIENEGENTFKTEFEFAGISVEDIENDWENGKVVFRKNEFKCIDPTTNENYELTTVYNGVDGWTTGVKGKRFSLNWIEHHDWTIKVVKPITRVTFKPFQDENSKWCFGYDGNPIKIEIPVNIKDICSFSSASIPDSLKPQVHIRKEKEGENLTTINFEDLSLNFDNLSKIVTEKFSENNFKIRLSTASNSFNTYIYIEPENSSNTINLMDRTFDTKEELYAYMDLTVKDGSDYTKYLKQFDSYFTLSYWLHVKFDRYPAEYTVNGKTTKNSNSMRADDIRLMSANITTGNNIYSKFVSINLDNRNSPIQLQTARPMNIINWLSNIDERFDSIVNNEYDYIYYDNLKFKSKPEFYFCDYVKTIHTENTWRNGYFESGEWINNAITGVESTASSDAPCALRAKIEQVEVETTKTVSCHINYDNGTDDEPEAIVLNPGDTIQTAIDQLSPAFLNRPKDENFSYRFKGFAASADSTEVLDSSNEVTEDMELFALWDETPRRKIPITFRLHSFDKPEPYVYQTEVYADEYYYLTSFINEIPDEYKTRKKDRDNTYTFKSIAFSDENGEITGLLDPSTYQLFNPNNNTVESINKDLCVTWNETPRAYTTEKIKIYKYEGSDEYEEIEYRIYSDDEHAIDGLAAENLVTTGLALSQLSNEFKTREKDENYTYRLSDVIIRGIDPNSDGILEKYNDGYLVWDATERTSINMNIRVHKNDNSDPETIQEIPYRDYDDEDTDTLTVGQLIGTLTNEIKQREKDRNYTYMFAGISTSPEGEPLDEETTIQADSDLFIIWDSFLRTKISVTLRFHDNYSDPEEVYEYNEEIYADEDKTFNEIYETLPERLKVRPKDDDFSYNFMGFSTTLNGKVNPPPDDAIKIYANEDTNVVSMDLYSRWLETERLYREGNVHILKDSIGTEEAEDIPFRIYYDEEVNIPDPEKIAAQLSDEFKQKESTDDRYYTFKRVVIDENGGPYNYYGYIEWEEHERTITDITVTVHKITTGIINEETGEIGEIDNPVEFNFSDASNIEEDDVNVETGKNKLEESFFEKEKDFDNTYEFEGFYTNTETKELLPNDYRITENIDLYPSWKVIPRPRIPLKITVNNNYAEDIEPFVYDSTVLLDNDYRMKLDEFIDFIPEEYKTRAKDSENTYNFLGLSTEPNGEILDPETYTFTEEEGSDSINANLYIIWESVPRPYTIETIRVFKEENSEEYEDVSYRNYEDEEDDNAPTSERLESLLSPEFKLKESDINNYAFDGVVVEPRDDGTYKAYCTWSAFPRPYKTINVTINKNDGSSTEPFVYTFKDVTDTDIDDTTVGDVIAAIPEEFKTRERNANNFFTFIGLSDSIESSTPLPEDQKILDDVQLFALWEMSDRPFKIIHVTVHKNDGTDYTKVFDYKDILDKEDDIYTIENVLADIEDDLKKRENDDTYSYIFAGISDTPDGEVIDTLTQITDDIDLYIKWTPKERPFKIFTVTVHKNNGSQVTSVLEFKDMTDTSEDNITIRKIIDRLSEQFKTREQSDEFNYTFAGLSDVATGICLSEASVIANDCNLYAVWNIEERLFNPIKVIVYKNDNTSSAITLNYKDIIDMDKDDLYLNTVLNDLPYDFKERSRTATHSYEFAGIAETPDGEILDPDKFAIPADKNFYLKWTEHVREFNEIKITIHKNDGTEETRELDFKDMLDDDFDDVYLSLINDRLSDEFKNRPSDSEWIYEFGGLSLTADGEAITNFENRFTDNMELYIVWNKTDINLVRDIIEYKKVIKIRPHDILRKFQDSEGKWCYGVVTIQQFDTVDQFDYLDDENIVNINLKTTPDGILSKIINFSQTLSHLPAYLKPEMFSTVQIKAKIYDNGEKTFEILIPDNINIFENGFETEEELDAAIAEASVAENNAPMYSLFYVNVERNKGEHPETVKVSLHKNDGSSIIEEIDADVSNGPVTIKSIIDSFLENYPDFTKRDSTDLFSYTFNNYALDINNSKSLTDFELENRMVYTNPLTLYCIWNEYDRTYSDIDLLVHKNDGSAEYEKISFRELDDTDIDDVDYIMVQDRLSESLKTRNHDDIYLYHFAGISESPNGEVINSTEYKFKESKNLYIIWEKEKLIPEDPDETPDNKDEFVKAGDLKLIEDTLFIIPEDIGNIKKIEYCNDYYYVLCDNNKVYKISVQDDIAKIENILDLSGYNADSSDTDIIACENVLIIKAGDYILTDKETIKSNFGISESPLSFKIDDTIKTLNTKTIAIINSK